MQQAGPISWAKSSTFKNPLVGAALNSRAVDIEEDANSTPSWVRLVVVTQRRTRKPMGLRPLTNGKPFHRLGQAPARTSSHIPCTRSPNLIPDLKSLDRPRRSGWRTRWTMTATMHVKTTLKIVSTTIAFMDKKRCLSRAPARVRSSILVCRSCCSESYFLVFASYFFYLRYNVVFAFLLLFTRSVS